MYATIIFFYLQILSKHIMVCKNIILCFYMGLIFGFSYLGKSIDWVSLRDVPWYPQFWLLYCSTVTPNYFMETVIEVHKWLLHLNIVSVSRG
jgi:hypothetical protein